MLWMVKPIVSVQITLLKLGIRYTSLVIELSQVCCKDRSFKEGLIRMLGTRSQAPPKKRSVYSMKYFIGLLDYYLIRGLSTSIEH